MESMVLDLKVNSMLLDLFRFERMFPNYYDFMVPMWSDWGEEDDKFILSVAVPGFKKDDFELFVEDGELLLKITSKKRKLLYSIFSSFYRNSCDFDKAGAEYKDGVLKVTIPKSEAKKKKAIQIEIL